MTTKLEQENKRLQGGWSEASRDRVIAKINQAHQAAQEFVDYDATGFDEDKSPICEFSLALLLIEIRQRLDDIEFELKDLQRRIE